MKRNLIKGLLVCVFATGVLIGVSVKAEASTIKEGYVTASVLNVRSEQSIHSKKIGEFKRNSKVKILSVGTEWDKVQYGNKTGYVYKEYIREIKSNDTSLNVKGQVINISSSLRVRSSASTNSSTLGYLKNGSKIDIVSKSGNWYKIKYNGSFGYIFGDYVKIINNTNSSISKPSNNTNTVQAGEVINISSSLRVRSSASTNSSTLGYLKNGTKLNILGKSGNWYKIKYNGRIGYVSGDYVKVYSNSKPQNKPNENNNTNSSSQQQTGLAGKIASTKTAKQTNQIILVINNKLTFWEKDKGGKWNEKISTSSKYGYAGLTDNKHEGDGATPTGSYPILYGFGFGSNPGTGLNYRKITKESYFVDDINSKYYNQWYEGTGQKGEHMIDHPQYKYGMVLGYNTSHTPGKGSAIFLHCNGKGNTAGCVSIPENEMLKLLKETNKGAYIIITTSESNLKYY